MKRLIYILLAAASVVVIHACKKNNTGPDNPGGNQDAFHYSDSLLYVKATTYTVQPVNSRAGSYSVFPSQGLEVDPVTGVITVRHHTDISGPQTETGLRYKITFTPAGSAEKESFYVTVSGINYTDVIFYTTDATPVSMPVYNSNRNLAVPSGKFRASGGCPIDSLTGGIDMKKVMDSDFLRYTQNQEEKNVTITYTLDDGSNKIEQRMVVRLYWYENNARLNNDGNLPKDIASNAAQLFMVGEPDPEIAPLRNLKPRPPCIVIVGN